MKSLKNSCLLLFVLFYSMHQVKAQCMVVNTTPSYNCLTSALELTITVSSSTSSPPYTVTSSPAGISAIMTGSSIVITNITYQPAYYLTITGSGGCTGFGSVLYSNPTASNNITVTNTNVTCYGGNDGAAIASFAGGGPYTWQWSTGSTNTIVTGLVAGTYTVTITNGSGCTATTPFVISSPPQISSVLSPSAIACFGATISAAITTTGGVSPFTYTVNGNALTGSPGNLATNLSAGMQTIITKDSKGCIEINSLMLNQAAQQVITPTITTPNCPGQSNGAIGVSVNGPVAGYSYSWSPGGATTTSLINIPSGNYTLYVLDASNCITRSVITVPQAPAITPVPVVKKENCSAVDGAFTMSVLGGNAPFTYTTLPNTQGPVVSGLSSGNYTTVIKDAHGCVDTTVTFVGNLSTVSIAILTVTPVKCYNTCNGSVIINVANAVQPVTYSITGLPSTTNNAVTNLCAGIYFVKAVDNIGCPAFDTINFHQPPAFSYSVSTPSTICIGKLAQLKADASGGNGALSYHWNPGALSGPTVNVGPVVTTVYSLNVYDSQGCTLAPYQVTVTVNPPITIAINSSDAGICPGTTAQITPTVSGGDGNYTYEWLPGGSHQPSIFVASVIIPTYTLFVNDGCGTPEAIKAITIKLLDIVQPAYQQVGQGGCSPYCTTFINTTPGAKQVIWNYGDRPYEQMGDTTFYCYQKAGDFNLRMTVTDANSCQSSFTYTSAVHVLVRPEAGFVTNPAIVTLNDADNVLLKNTSNNATEFSWSINGLYLGSRQNINYTFQDTGCYDIKLVAGNENQCKDSTVRSICVFEGFNFYMPSAFTPNNDGLNDVLLPKGTGWLFTNYTFEVFNRWGHKIFSTNNVREGWDGGLKVDPYLVETSKADPNDLYSWRAVVTDNMQQSHEFRGYVAILR